MSLLKWFLASVVVMLLWGDAAAVCPPVVGSCDFNGSSVAYFAGFFASPVGDAGMVKVKGTVIPSWPAVMIIQMQDGTYNTSNSNAFGGTFGGPNTGFGYDSLGLTGRYEFNYIVSSFVVSGDTTLLLEFPLNVSFTSAGASRFQVVSFLMCDQMNVIGHAQVPWDGEKGGVLPIIAKTIHFAVNVSMDGMGFRGGALNATDASAFDIANYATMNSLQGDARKGEGFLGNSGTYSNMLDSSIGAPGNAGGGGHAPACGGGGGASIGSGGIGQSGTYNGFIGNGGLGGYETPISLVGGLVERIILGEFNSMLLSRLTAIQGEGEEQEPPLTDFPEGGEREEALCTSILSIATQSKHQ